MKLNHNGKLVLIIKKNYLCEEARAVKKKKNSFILFNFFYFG